MEKYTIIIPTRDRAETLEATLRTCTRQAYENLEIIVSDNCSDDNTRAIVDCCGDPRVRYINPGRRLSMAGNFEFSLGHVTDGFVMFIGSDDGVMPDAVEYVDSLVTEHGVDAVSCRQATYVWPDFPDETIAGRLVFGGARDDVEIRRPDEWIRRTLGFQVHYCFELPNLYCGFVHRRVIDRAVTEQRYFRSITPDAYSALATAIFIDRYAFSHKPFVIAGASVKSNGASDMHAVGSRAEVAKFHSENDLEFHPGFIHCPSYEVILAETFAQLADAFPAECKSYKIDHESMLRAALANANERTEGAIRAAVSEMAANFGIALEPNAHGRRVPPRGRWGTVLRALAKLLSSRVVAIPRSMDVGIQNVDDAALAAHLMRQDRRSGGFATIRTLVTERVRQRLGL